MPQRFPLILCVLIIASLQGKPLKAWEQGLSEAWLRALHYWPNHQLYKSEIDDPRFFLHPQGKEDPQSEWIANQEAFLQDRNYVCKFPYRSKLIAASLKKTIVDNHCKERLEPFRRIFFGKSMAPRLSVIYASAYTGHLASVFGHVFLKVSDSRSTVDDQLFDPVINFVAYIPKEDPLSKQMIAGMFGAYTGEYRLYTYGKRLYLYTQQEKRTLFEYELSLPSNTIKDLVDHIFELREQVKIPYGFFASNCTSYLLLALEGVYSGLKQDVRSFFYETPLSSLWRLSDANLLQHPIEWPRQSKADQEYILPPSFKPRDLSDQTLPHHWSRHMQAAIEQTGSLPMFRFNPFISEFGPNFLDQALTELKLLEINYNPLKGVSVSFIEALKLQKFPLPSYGLELTDNHLSIPIGMSVYLDQHMAIYGLIHQAYADERLFLVPSLHVQGAWQTLQIKGSVLYDRYKHWLESNALWSYRWTTNHRFQMGLVFQKTGLDPIIGYTIDF